MSDYSIGDLIAALNGGGGNWGGNGMFLLVLIVVFMLVGGRGYNGGEFGQYATAASQQEILFGQQFGNLDNKMDRGFTSIGNGISSATFALKDSIVGEGRAVQMQMTNDHNAIMTAIRDDGEKTRALINANEMQRIRDERDYYRGMWGQRQEGDRILATQGRYYNNPPCTSTDPCGCC